MLAEAAAASFAVVDNGDVSLADDRSCANFSKLELDESLAAAEANGSTDDDVRPPTSRSPDDDLLLVVCRCDLSAVDDDDVTGGRRGDKPEAASGLNGSSPNDVDGKSGL